MAIKRATKLQSKLRMALNGPAGVGKTMTALKIATALAAGGKVGAIDTERGSMSKYADQFTFDVDDELHDFSPDTYIRKISEFAALGYSVLIIDSLSHAWMGKNGALEQVDKAAKKANGNSFSGWRDVTPMHNRLVDAILNAPMHVIVTMRTKMEYVIEKDERTGKSVPRKVGMAPVQRDGLEYEFDVVGDLNLDNDLIIGKTRCPALAGQIFHRAGEDVAAVLRNWLTDGAEPQPAKESDVPAPAALATAEQVNHINNLLHLVNLPAGTVGKWLAKAGVDSFSKMDADTAAKCIEFLEARTPSAEPSKPSTASPAPEAPSKPTAPTIDASDSQDEPAELTEADFQTPESLEAAISEFYEHNTIEELRTAIERYARGSTRKPASALNDKSRMRIYVAAKEGRFTVPGGQMKTAPQHEPAMA